MIVILSTADSLAAQHALDLLVEAGLDATSAMVTNAITGAVKHEVRVAGRDAEAAAAVLADAPPATKSLVSTAAWRCRDCGERIEPPFDTCWKCGASRSGEPALAPEVPAERLGDADAERTPATPPGPGAELAASPTAAPPAGRPQSTALRNFELGVVLWFGWLLPMVNAVFTLAGSSTDAAMPRADAAFNMLIDLRDCGLIVLIVALGTRAWARHGILRPRALPDLGLGVLLVAIVEVVRLGLLLAMFEMGADRLFDLWPAAQAPERLHQLWPLWDGALLLASTLTAAAAEELVFRAYLLPRLADVFRSRTIATLVSTTLFASYHAHQGPAGVFSAFVFGFVAACGFWIIGRVWPLILAHALANLVTLLFFT